MGGTVKPGGTNIILRNITFAPGYGNRSFNEPTRVPAAGDFPIPTPTTRSTSAART